MVVKPNWRTELPPLQFESRVVLDGSQTLKLLVYIHRAFESRVVLDARGKKLRAAETLHAVFSFIGTSDSTPPCPPHT